MEIIVIGPHPDDFEYGCGGTLIKLARAGHHISLLVLSGGEMGGDAGKRKKEQQVVAEILNADLFWGPFRDTEIPLNKVLIDSIEKFILERKPNITFVPSLRDTHQDHRNVSQAIITATRYLQNVLYYEGPTNTEFTPAIFEDIGDVLEDKLKLLAQHASQAHRTNVSGMSIMDYAQATATFRGFQNRCRYAEGFMPLRISLGLVKGFEL